VVKVAGMCPPAIALGLGAVCHRDVKNRDGLKAHLQDRGIPSVIYYVKPLHSQVAYRDFPRTPLGLPVSEACRNASFACRCTPI
jgi:dTDP-4-amino-4,6-dideoxygalactose transaminase